MIRGVHTMFYSSEPEALRAFLRDTLELPPTDLGDGWLVFDLPEADMGCHPAGPSVTDGVPAGTHAISFYCDDLSRSVHGLRARGVVFTEPITDAGYGLTTAFTMPGGVTTRLYQPYYSKPRDAATGDTSHDPSRSRRRADGSR